MAENQPEQSQQQEPPFSKFSSPGDALLRDRVLLPPGRPGILGVLDEFELVTLIGEGGMGLVYKARDINSDRWVAIKVLRPDLVAHASAAHRFAKEAEHMKNLQHPNIVEVLKVGRQKDVPYFAMPFMEAGSLASVIQPGKLPTTERCLSTARQVAEALKHAHSRGVTHRDLKPANVLLDDAGNAMVTDFGLARTVFNDSWIDVANAHCEGTAPYMSPQLARGEAEDSRCDIYALGSLLYEMLTGRAPYEGPSDAQIIQQIRLGPPPPILKLRPDAPKPLVHVAEAAMAREHRDRYANMTDLLEDLKRIQEGQPLLGPHAPLNLGRLWARASRPLFATTAGALVLAGGVFGYGWLTRKPALEMVRTLSLPQVVSWSGALPGDWDGDGQKDILLAQDDKLLVISAQGQQYRPLPLEAPHTTAMALSLVEDITGDGLDEAFVSWSDGSNAFLAALNRQGWPVKTFRFSGSMNLNPVWGTNQTQLTVLKLTDLDQDKHRELLVRVTSSWSKRPRGVCCFDLETTNLKWFYETAPFVTSLQTLDLDGDGKLEIVIGSNAPCNGSELEDGTDDNHAYVYALTAEGKLLWRRQVGDYFCNAVPIATRTGQPGVLVRVASIGEHNQSQGDPEQGEVLEFDPQGQVIQRYNAGVQLLSGLAADLDQDGKQEVLLTDRQGFLHVLDGGLKLRQKAQLATNRFTSVNLQLAAISLLDSDPKPELLLTSSKVWNRAEPVIGNSREKPEVNFYDDNEVLVLDSRLQLVAQKTMAKRWTQFPGLALHVLPGKVGEAPQLLVLSDKIEYLRFIR